ncbi:MAG TPA: hypothetical protein VFH29_01335, partial [Anaerolineales bacterium]|nr:hypothetical protein [Anaerolineales bacterium]
MGAVALVAGVLWTTGIASQLLRDATPLYVRVVGHSWWWEFEYPGLRIKTATELHLPAGRRV